MPAAQEIAKEVVPDEVVPKELPVIPGMQYNIAIPEERPPNFMDHIYS